MKNALLTLSLLGLSFATAKGQPAALAQLMEVVEAQAQLDLWPNYEPLQTPLALYDGATTYLLGHPDPPSEFEAVSSQDDVFAYTGRHPNVFANSTAMYNEVLTATVMLRKPIEEHDLTDLAALILHERFHAFQRLHHPTWQSNEAALFMYPFEDIDQLTERRKETEALIRAFSTDQRTCWTATAMHARQTRYAQLDSTFIAYERGADWNEGLATYVEWKAAQKTTAPITKAFAPEGIRWRAYDAGAAIGLLLDRYDSNWRETLSQDDSLPIDVLLTQALPTDARSACAFTSEEESAIRQQAQADIAALQATKTQKRMEFFAQDGWSILVEAQANAPLWGQGFDPLNVLKLNDREILHSRFFKAGNEHGTIEMVGMASLTVGAGAHPLFNGIAALHVTGLDDDPALQVQDGTLSFSSDVLTLELKDVTISKEGKEYTLRLN